MRKLNELIYTSYYVDTQLTVKITDNYTKKNASPAIGGIITIIDGSNNRWTGVCYASPNPDAVIVVQDYWHIDITAYSTPVIDNGNTWYFTQNYYFMGGSPTIPSTLPYLGEISSADYNAGKAVLRMLDSVSWYIDGDSFLNYNFIDLPSAAMSQPYPHALWRITEGVNDGLPFNRLMIDIKEHVPAEPVRQKEYITVHDMDTPQAQLGGHGLAILTPTVCRITEVLNGEWSVYLEHPIDSDGKWKYLLEYNLLKINGQYFVIYKTDHYYSGSKGIVKVYADHIFYQINNAWLYPGTVIPKVPKIKNIISRAFLRADFRIEQGQNVYQFTYDSNIEKTAYGGDWDMHDSSGMTLTEFLMGSDGVIPYSQGELYRNNTYLSVNTRMENSKDNAFDIRVGLNLRGIKRTVDLSTVCTYFRGYDNFGNLFGISWTPGALERRIPRHVVRAQLFNYDNPNWDTLVADTRAFFDANCKPKVTYTIDLIDVRNNPDYAEFTNHARYKVGDKGLVYDERLNLSITLEITRTVTDGITGEVTQVTFGESRSFTKISGYPSSVVTPELAVLNGEIKRNKALALTSWEAVSSYTWGQLAEFTWTEVSGDTT